MDGMTPAAELEGLLARAARACGLDALNVQDAREDDVRAFAAAVLEELAARGLVHGEDRAIACHARPSTRGH